jgi:hypothetical protein
VDWFDSVKVTGLTSPKCANAELAIIDETTKRKTSDWTVSE